MSITLTNTFVNGRDRIKVVAKALGQSELEAFGMLVVLKFNYEQAKDKDIKNLSQWAEFSHKDLEEVLRRTDYLTDQDTIELKLKKFKPKPIVTTVGFSDIDYALALKWADLMTQQTPWRDAPDVDKYATEIARVKRLLNMTDEGIERVFKFIDRDEFWRTVATSPTTLLKKSKNGLRKIDNILMAMRRNHQGTYSSEEVAKQIDRGGW